DRDVEIVQAALGAMQSEIDLHLNLDNPTVSTASVPFISAAQRAAGWEGQQWEQTIRVRQTTLDALIERFGEPHFVKIDVEGFEAEVLRGLSCPLASLSFEFTTIQRGVAQAALAECERLGRYRYNAALGESQRLLHARWLDGDAAAAWLERLPDDANSGDIYAVLQ
ncbi:MAG: FkbM family methyltransferase, partial [Thiohalocapsa sp.]